MKTFIYNKKQGEKTKIFETNRLNALKIIRKNENIDLGTINSYNIEVLIKTYKNYGPFLKVESEKDLLK